MLKKKNNLLQFYAEEVREEILDRLSYERRKKRQAAIRLINYVVWLLVAGLVLILINIAALYPSARDGYRSVQSAKNDLLKAQAEAFGENRQSVAEYLYSASKELSSALLDLHKIKYSPVGWLPIVNQKLSDTEKVLTAAKLTADSVAQVWVPGQSLFRLLPGAKSLNFAKMKPEEKSLILESVASGQKLLPKLEANLISARNLLKSIEDPGIFAYYGLDIEEASIRLDQGIAMAKQAEPIALLLPALAGHGKEASFLLIMQNRHELRPTGGFIGTFGLAQVREGEVQRLETRDVYKLDWPVKDKLNIEPPMPIKKYLGQARWFFRDANWNPSWPITAQKLIWFYDKENKLAPTPDKQADFDFVVGMTADTIVDLIRLTGNVTVRGQTYTPENFVDLLQVNTELDYQKFGFSRDERKAVIGEIAKELQARLLNNLDKYWRPVSDILTDNLEKKNMQVWASDAQIAKYFADQGWDGSMAETDGDYLMLVDANLHALKTDAVINRALSYELKQTADGLVAKFDVSYAHSGGTDWKTGPYRTYARLYVPKGAQLIKLSGASGAADIGEENGKAYFGAFLQIEPGKIGGLSFEYKLPYNLLSRLNRGNYGLLVQKQSGTMSNLAINLNFLKPVKKYSPANLYSYRLGSNMRWQDKLVQDMSFQVDF